MAETFDSRAAGLFRSFMALLILVAFWAALGYTFWPELLPGVLRTAQGVRGIGGEEVESRYFDVRNSSEASSAQVRGVVTTLETDYAAILEYLDRPAAEPIPVLITNGAGPAIADGYRLNVMYDNGVMDLSLASFFLATFALGQDLTGGGNLFIAAGLANYVNEEIGRADGYLGQPADAWVELLRRQSAVLPLASAWETGLPQDENELFDFLRAFYESGSFVRWLVANYGLESALELADGMSLESVIGMSLAEAQDEWLASVAAGEIEPRHCQFAIYRGGFPMEFCELLDETTD